MPTPKRSTTPALPVVIAILTAQQQGPPVTVEQLVEDTDVLEVVRLLAELAGGLLDRLEPDRGASWLRDRGAEATRERP